jgi:hypothetical protein
LPPELIKTSPYTINDVAFVFDATRVPSTVRLLHTASVPVESIVTVTPAGITASSAAVGTL